MVLRIYREKILLVRHIRNLDSTTIARQVYEEQQIQKWPGLAMETSKICFELGIEDCNTTHLSKEAYSKILIAALHKKIWKSCDFWQWENVRGSVEKSMVGRNTLTKKVFLILDSSIAQDLASQILPVIIETIKDISRLEGCADVRNQGRRSPICCRVAARCLGT